MEHTIKVSFPLSQKTIFKLFREIKTVLYHWSEYYKKVTIKIVVDE